MTLKFVGLEQVISEEQTQEMTCWTLPLKVFIIIIIIILVTEIFSNGW
jgi:hypothetical protein